VNSSQAAELLPGGTLRGKGSRIRLDPKARFQGLLQTFRHIRDEQ
jgi:hypothetical protein